MKITILVPCFNEEEVIETTHRVLFEEINQLSPIEFEVLYVNDGSSDRTLGKLKDIAQTEDRVKYISFSRNFGKESAMLAGLKNATGDAVIIMDADLQNPPRLIKEMIKKFEEGYDIVNGKRTRTGDNKWSTFFAQSFYKLSDNLMDVKLTDGISDFRLLSRKVINALVSMEEYNRFSKGLFSWVGFNETVIEYENEPRFAGETKFSFVKSINYAIDGIVAFNDKPLRIVFLLGLMCILISVVYILWLLYSYFFISEEIVKGYFTTIFTVVLFGGVQLVSIGVLGEYIGKIFYEVKKRPHYIIEETNVN